jgi:hypothetical protein
MIITICVLLLIIALLLTINISINERLENLSSDLKVKFTPWFRKIPKGIYKFLPAFLICLFLLLYGISVHDIFSPKVNDGLEKASFALLSSGAFAAVLKSIQFTGIFKEEISSVMLTPKFIENRNDLKSLWSTISKAVYNQKFPDISLDIEKRILDSYFPIIHEYYFIKHITTINITEITDDFVLKYNQISDFVIMPESGKTKTNYVKTNTISVNKEIKELIDKGLDVSEKENVNSEEEKIIKDKLLSFTCDGEVRVLEESKKTINNIYTREYTTVLEGEGPFHIITEYEKQYSLKNENYKIIRFGTFVKETSVLINHPKDVSVSFFNIGNAIAFEEKHKGIENQIYRKHSGDVLMPYQGFGMSFEKHSTKK